MNRLFIGARYNAGPDIAHELGCPANPSRPTDGSNESASLPASPLRVEAGRSRWQPL